MGIKITIRDLLEKGIDPSTAVIGADGLFKAPNIQTQEATEEIYGSETISSKKNLRNGLILIQKDSNKSRKNKKSNKTE